MPHAVLTGKIDLHAFAALHAPLELRDEQGVHTLGGIYVAPDGRRAVLEASSGSYGRTRRYWLALQRRASPGRGKSADGEPASGEPAGGELAGGEVVIGLADVEGPAITKGLLRLLEALVRCVLQRFPDARVARTNLAGITASSTSHGT